MLSVIVTLQNGLKVRMFPMGDNQVELKIINFKDFSSLLGTHRVIVPDAQGVIQVFQLWENKEKVG